MVSHFDLKIQHRRARRKGYALRSQVKESQLLLFKSHRWILIITTPSGKTTVQVACVDENGIFHNEMMLASSLLTRVDLGQNDFEDLRNSVLLCQSNLGNSDCKTYLNLERTITD
ncbi:hypothetical protein VNO77_41844 [Canavalia gladiata]|uniref:Uncharacterized protein n=1 Tax=Canavalia gladiata TaxID=3824 RepID=A0AAN9K274_CANGL